MKITVFVQELLSVVLTPFVLWFSLPPCADNIIDFFREFTVHVEGVGYVCSFAVFDFKRHGNVKVRSVRSAQQLLLDTYSDLSVPAVRRSCRHSSQRENDVQGREDGEVILALHRRRHSFSPACPQKLMGSSPRQATHPEWQPSDPSASIFLSKMTDQPVLRSPQLRKGRLSHQHGPSNELPESDYLRDRSQVYERALQRSIMMRSSTKPLPTRNSPNRPFRRGPRERLESMQEQAEVNEAGWDTAEVVPGAGNDSDESDGVIHGRKGSLKDNGMIGLIQHVMK
jgi:autophagy-related protein 9